MNKWIDAILHLTLTRSANIRISFYEDNEISGDCGLHLVDSSSATERIRDICIYTYIYARHDIWQLSRHVLEYSIRAYNIAGQILMRTTKP